jgi:3-methyl-2-oxobutanoate hydroxymethyltransferase
MPSSSSPALPDSLLAKFNARKPLSMLTAYDALMARIAQEVGIDILLVGDSVGRAMLGYASEREVTLADMLHHVRAVRRGAKEAFVLADLPFGTFRDEGTAYKSARLLCEAGADAVKIEGPSPALIRALANQGIRLCTHLGFQPQHHDVVKVQGKNAGEALALVQQAKEAEEAGSLMLLLELIPEDVAQAIAARLHIPVIGIGAGSGLGGQVLVITDLLGMTSQAYRHNRRYAEGGMLVQDALAAYARDVASGAFPAAQNATRLKPEERGMFEQGLASRP